MTHNCAGRDPLYARLVRVLESRSYNGAPSLEPGLYMVCHIQGIQGPLTPSSWCKIRPILHDRSYEVRLELL